MNKSTLDLGDKFRLLCEELTIRRQHVIQDEWDRIFRHYSEPHRHYHTLDHIRDGLEVLDVIGAALPTKLAWWIHDVIYDPAAKDNEEKSADFFVDFWEYTPESLGDAVYFRDEVTRLVLLTKTHDPEPFDKNGNDMCVADLHGLAAKPEVYALNAFNIRKEYAQFSDAEWRQGRLKFLDGWQERDIFPPSPTYFRMQGDARLNMIEEKLALFQG